MTCTDRGMLTYGVCQACHSPLHHDDAVFMNCVTLETLVSDVFKNDLRVLYFGISFVLKTARKLNVAQELRAGDPCITRSAGFKANVNRQLSKKLVAPLLKEIKQKMFLLRGKKV
jgi:hypothetical protein